MNRRNEEEEFGGVGGYVVNKFLGSLGISQEQVDKVKAIIDMVEVKDDGNTIELIINMKKVTVKIAK